MTLPILYSFRRCPYAIRARLALAASGLHPGRNLELREVGLKAKPPELLQASTKGTVPVLVPAAPQPTGTATETTPVLDESLAIMQWALTLQDPGGWWHGRSSAERVFIDARIAENDGPFKHHLDRFKYAARDGSQGLADQQRHRAEALAILRDWNRHIRDGGWLLGDRPSLADWALLPFVRQFDKADPAGLEAEAGLEALKNWLARFLQGPELAAVMAPPWAERIPWRSPGWLYHLALRDDWHAARAAGSYRISTRGRTLDEVGFIHLSQAHQVEATAARFYGDLPGEELILLTIDPAKLACQGLAVRLECAVPALGPDPDPDRAPEQCSERFPHLYAALPLDAVIQAGTLFKR